VRTGGPKKTLERVLSKAGIGSRTQARSWIHAGRVTVNGRITENPDQWIDFARDRVLFDGKPLDVRERLYILLYKPTGYITTFKDPEGRPTVYDLIQDVDAFVSPVGRLDLDTSGLLILTNDTRLSEQLTNPDRGVAKTYLVKCSSILSDEALEQLRSGVELSDGPTRPASVRRVRDSGRYSHIEITIHEGRNRQVRRMIEAVDSKVLKLVRIRVGPISIGDLRIGHWRELTSDELQLLAPGRAPRPSPTKNEIANSEKTSPTRKTHKSRRPVAGRVKARRGDRPSKSGGGR
jgi:23S rRNA pseudouridine2605 synthase